MVFECVSGSQAYGTAVEGSDVDYKGVFMAPEEQLLGLELQGQVNEDNNDKAYYELGKFLDLLSKSNPNMLEMLNVPDDCVLYRHQIMDLIQPATFITKACEKAFAGYAQTQIKKARGLNKKILNPIEPQRKGVLDFCFVVQNHHSIPVRKWLSQKQWIQEDCGLVSIPHASDLYALYHADRGVYRGLVSSESASELVSSSVKKEELPEAYLTFNRNGYKSHCKEYKEYWAWVEKRNELRYENTMTHGKRYDAKNMMHTFRLLNMAYEIAESGIINVRRPDREFLLKIRSGAFEYNQLLEMAEGKIAEISLLFAKSNLPEEVDRNYVNDILVRARKQFYSLFA